MKLVSTFLSCFLVCSVAAVISDPCDQFKLQISTIQTDFKGSLATEKEKFVTELEIIFFEESTTNQEKQSQIESVLSKSKENFELLKNKAFENIGKLIDADPRVISMKLLHAYNIVKFPYICAMLDAELIAASGKTSEKYVFDYGNKLMAEL